jgi:hypothetical protein
VAKGELAVMTVAMSSPAEGARWTVLPRRPHTEMCAAIANTGAQLASQYRAQLMRSVAQSKSLDHVSTFLTGGLGVRPIAPHGRPRVVIARPYTRSAVEINIAP